MRLTCLVQPPSDGGIRLSPSAWPCSKPDLQKQGNGFRNPRISGNPPTHGACIDPQALGGLNLVQAQLAEGVAELPGRHGHGIRRKLPALLGQGKVPQLPSVPALSDRALCPTFSSLWFFTGRSVA